MPAPLAIPPTTTPSEVCAVVFVTVSVVKMAAAAAGPPSMLNDPHAFSIPAHESRHRQPLANEPRGAHGDVRHGQTQQLRRPLGAVRSVLSACRTGAGVGSPRVQQDRTQPPVGDHTSRPLDRSGRTRLRVSTAAA